MAVKRECNAEGTEQVGRGEKLFGGGHTAPKAGNVGTKGEQPPTARKLAEKGRSKERG